MERTPQNNTPELNGEYTHTHTHESEIKFQKQTMIFSIDLKYFGQKRCNKQRRKATPPRITAYTRIKRSVSALTQEYQQQCEGLQVFQHFNRTQWQKSALKICVTSNKIQRERENEAETTKKKRLQYSRTPEASNTCFTRLRCCWCCCSGRFCSHHLKI